MALPTHITLPTALLSMISVPLCSASLYDPPDPAAWEAKGRRWPSASPTPALTSNHTVADASYQPLIWEAGRRTHVEYFGQAKPPVWLSVHHHGMRGNAFVA